MGAVNVGFCNGPETGPIYATGLSWTCPVQDHIRTHYRLVLLSLNNAVTGQLQVQRDI